MKNKKKNWRRILLRGSALMAAVFMCFAGSFPAFAAEDPAEPGGSVDVLEGEWTLRPYMTIPSRSFYLEGNFTVTGSASVDGVHYDFVGQCDSIDVLIDDGYDLAVMVNVVSSVPNFEDYGESYPFAMHVYKKFANGEISFAGFVEPVTIDFGDGVVVDDPYVYEWFTSNAIPHRDMWSLTDRLQAVAASIWSVIVTISSTIVSNPLLLFTSGFLFLGGCIALFSRLLARR